MIQYAYYNSPFGLIKIGDSDGSIVCITRADSPDAQHSPTAITDLAFRQLSEYFAGSRAQFDFPIAPRGTAFQTAVWNALLDLPYGQTRSYKDIAAAIGNPKACRAVGMANHRNPIWIAIPCHRVVGSNQSLTGYAGGLDMKQALLELERSHASSL